MGTFSQGLREAIPHALERTTGTLYENRRYFSPVTVELIVTFHLSHNNLRPQ
ncbi:hypothetical protein [Endozoicomonas sp. 8E]|uniref:hypothetical protein n=1 Tax=Endozoicomonas sp. 8E TaxID=3035692 RepID=UPI0029392B0E|nr:hypothetical protein [Endozoicomonas sp. 8E]WOG29915.1 hypothetical protein P6910_09735 [Endozoicomonas sp. 8E]